MLLSMIQWSLVKPVKLYNSINSKQPQHMGLGNPNSTLKVLENESNDPHEDLAKVLKKLRKLQ